jgi:hypothetical protein
MESSSDFKNVQPFPFDITAKEGDAHKHKVPCLVVSQFLYLSFVTIIRKTSRLCRELNAILYLVQFLHFCANTDMIAAHKVLIYTNSCYMETKS